MRQIPDDDSLRALQKYIWQMNIERGFDAEDISKKLVQLVEEVGEVARAVRKSAGMKFTDTTKQTELADELADVLIVLLGMATLADIDIHDAFVAKEEKNRKRTWQ
jgi:NTP pyrophosphatase (non-canonical NTP hydrolase)